MALLAATGSLGMERAVASTCADSHLGLPYAFQNKVFYLIKVAKSYSGKIYGDANKERILSIITTRGSEGKGAHGAGWRVYLHCQRWRLTTGWSWRKKRPPCTEKRIWNSGKLYQCVSSRPLWRHFARQGRLSDEVTGRRVCWGLRAADFVPG